MERRGIHGGLTRRSSAMSSLRPLPFERKIYELETRLEQLEAEPNPTPATKDAIRKMRVEVTRMKREIFENLSAWDIVQVAPP